MTAPVVSISRPVRARRHGLRVVERLAGVVARVGDRLHADEDAAALAAGWDVTQTRWGGRTYRHPGFPRPSLDGRGVAR